MRLGESGGIVVNCHSLVRYSVGVMIKDLKSFLVTYLEKERNFWCVFFFSMGANCAMEKKL